jgi:hypothetical protein
MQGTHRKERISRLRGRALELETKLEGLSKSLLLKPGLYMAMSDREANAPNELSMQKFQSLRVIMIYSDGWGHCVNEDTGEEGVVPLSCLKSMDGFQVSELTDSDHTLVKEKKLLKKLSISDDILVKEPGIYTCVQDRLAERVNEISLEKGNQVRVLMVFSDGWGLCLDDSTGQQGIAPLNILKLQGFNLDPIQEQRNQSSKSLGYYRVLVDRIPIQPNEVLLLRGNVVQVLTIYSDGWCHW